MEDDAKYAGEWSEAAAYFLKYCQSLTLEEVLMLRKYKSFAYDREGRHIYVDGTMNDNAVHYPSEPDNANDTYYPRVFNERKPTHCPWAKDGTGKDIIGVYDCSTVPPCASMRALEYGASARISGRARSRMLMRRHPWRPGAA